MSKLVLIVVDLITVPVGFCQLTVMSLTVAFPTRETLHHKLNGSPTLGSPLASMFIVGGRCGATHLQK